MKIKLARAKDKLAPYKTILEAAQARDKEMGWDTRPLSDRCLTDAWAKRVDKIKL